MRPHIAVTLGDPRGVGPEVAFQAVTDHRGDLGDLSITFVGPNGARSAAPPGYDFVGVDTWDGTEEGAGRVAALAIERAVHGVLSGPFDAIVTAPLHKPALRAAGWDVPGQTELLQGLTGCAPVGMLMAAEKTRLGGPLRVLLATTHHPLRNVPGLVTEALLVEQITLLDRSLRSDWRVSSPRLALCALNPHASDDGLFGGEEARVFAPAIKRAREAEVDVAGPHPADTVFRRALAGNFDAVVAPYHDVGMAAFKTVSFGTGVNVTLGLPFVRTSPDHGTAFDIAGTGSADPSSMVEALRLAARLAQNRFDTNSADV